MDGEDQDLDENPLISESLYILTFCVKFTFIANLKQHIFIFRPGNVSSSILELQQKKRCNKRTPKSLKEEPLLVCHTRSGVKLTDPLDNE